jgi:hypothetical protein
VRDQAELRGQHDLVALALHGPPDELLVGEGAVDLGGVDERDAQLDRPVDGADRLGVVQVRRAVGPGHGHGAKADPGDVQVPQLDVLHPFPGLTCDRPEFAPGARLLQMCSSPLGRWHESQGPARRGRGARIPKLDR